MRISNRASAPLSRLSKMNQCAPTMAAGPKYCSSDQNTGHDVMQHAHRMHFVVSSKIALSATDCSRSWWVR